MKIAKKKDYYEIDFNIDKLKALPAVLIILTFLLNIYFFSANKGIWWDEAEYLSFVNHLVKGSPYALWEGRAIFYPLMLSIFGFINSSETFLRVGLVIIICLTIFFTYVSLQKLLNTKLAFLATLLLVSSWMYNFLSIRFLTEIPSLLFQMISLYFFFKDDKKSRVLSGLFLGLGIATRFTSLLIIPSYLIFDILSKKKIQNYIWIPAVLLGFIPILAYDLMIGRFPFETFYTFIIQSMMPRTWGRNLGDWTYYFANSPIILGSIISLVFLGIGLLFALSRIKTKYSNNIIFTLTYIIVYLITYSFLTELKEDRYMLPILPFIFIIVSMGLVSISKAIGNFISKKIKLKILKNAEYIILTILAALIIIPSFDLMKTTINNSANTYAELKYAGEEIKANTDSSQIIMTNDAPHITYYSERATVGFPSNESDLLQVLAANPNINYLTISFYETVPEYLMNLTADKFSIVQQVMLTSNENATAAATIAYLRQ
ncbi:Dolichyl-phosphate-mannose-protein mannosyltransferase [Candidatus Tiddalikarchaeum anstoanum]|nr:Dolichyl-phosphate-mannose-protein mannosyltransferase [Candidatus Tiddalikarchaeum anstoanum]